jgi:hypothetical protein
LRRCSCQRQRASSSNAGQLPDDARGTDARRAVSCPWARAGLTAARRSSSWTREPWCWKNRGRASPSEGDDVRADARGAGRRGGCSSSGRRPGVDDAAGGGGGARVRAGTLFTMTVYSLMGAKNRDRRPLRAIRAARALALGSRGDGPAVLLLPTSHLPAQNPLSTLPLSSLYSFRHASLQCVLAPSGRATPPSLGDPSPLTASCLARSCLALVPDPPDDSQ